MVILIHKFQILFQRLEPYLRVIWVIMKQYVTKSRFDFTILFIIVLFLYRKLMPKLIVNSHIGLRISGETYF